MTAHLGFERGKTVILVRGNIDFPGLSIPAQDTRKRGIKIKTEHRHPGIDTHASAVAELPSNAVEKVGTHRQPAIWELEGTDEAIAFWIGEGLKKNGIHPHIGYALDKNENGRGSCRERVSQDG